ncbi:MAG TPA: metal ABC transporter permease [Bacillota bacterium]|nr:metal ABC transporter permease [Bacillota bacterium]HPF42025.1 metal ABC transporter permease [Bacillota bacterium]HPJ85901.1 metal ABC transporter permease [Bacillota bacterium]HPQ61795.1 metal ABC transporter permease [Bacillota bacterium]HRX91228.1 metal ABC transporter permease [Candidatus Izemoplasmatales bacterium]
MMYTLSFFTDLFNYDFMLKALAAGVILGVIAPLIGSIVVVRRLSFIADTLGHFSLVGVSFSLFLSTIGISIFFDEPLFFGLIFSIVGGLLIEMFRRSYKSYKEISMVIVISLGTALSAVFFSKAKATGSLYTYLFGSILTVTNYYMYALLAITAVVAVLFLVFGRQIIAVSFDETSAKFLGINVNIFQILFMVVLSIVVSVMLEAAGVLLISSMMIIPVAAGMKLGWSYRSTLGIAVLFSELSVIFGLWAAYSLKIPSGATIVSINIIILLVVALIKKIVLKRQIAKLAKENPVETNW